MMRDDPAYNTLAKKPDFGDNRLIESVKELNPIDLDKDTNNPGSAMRDAVAEIDKSLE